MKNNFFKVILIILGVMLAITGCSKTDDGGSSANTNTSITGNSNGNSENRDAASDNRFESANSANSEHSSESNAPTSQADSAQTLQVSFGADGTSFTMYIYDNPTAAAIAKHVGTARWQLPIYHYDDYENWEVMQYYDVPSRYEIPSAAESISSEKAGEVYYSEPNRIVLFFGDAQVSGEYTPVGYFDPTAELISAVENNPVLEGWGNKIVIIQPGN